MTKPILELESIDPLDRPYLTIDGARFDLAVPEDFGLVESARMSRLLSIAQRLAGEAALLPADRAVDPAIVTQLEDLVDEQIALILRAPEDVRAKLNSSQKLEIVEAFTVATAERKRAPLPPRRRAPSTSDSSSPSSRPRTATRPRGSRCRSGS